MSVTPPEGMAQPTWDALLRFTQAHEGPTTYMYNNYPLKTSRDPDVTCGIGFRIETEDDAPGFAKLFFLNGTSSRPNAQQMREEFKRVAKIPRTADNLHSGFEATATMYMNKEDVWEYMQQLMKAKFERQRHQADTQFLDHLKDMPAQAQMALVSYNYGWEILSSPSLRRILNANYLDFHAAREQVLISKDNPELKPKNTAHQTLMWNAWQIVIRKGTPVEIPWNELPDGYHPPRLIPMPEGYHLVGDKLVSG